jgi:gluconolactonase
MRTGHPTAVGLAELLDGHAVPERLCDGFAFTEGPVWNPVEQRLYFSDLAGDARWRWSDAAGLELVERPTGKGNGMTYERDLTLVVCQSTTSRLLAYRPDGHVDVLASHHGSRELNSPNDVCGRSDGTLFFSDPTYGRMPHGGLEREPELDFRGVYAVLAGSRELRLLRDDFGQPNGLCLSPDESLLYVNDTPRAEIRALRVNAACEVIDDRVFAGGLGDGTVEDGPVDGMKCDEHGNVWITGPGGVWVFRPDGRRQGVVPVPEIVGNLAWGGADRRELFLCATSSLYRLRTRVRGRREPFMPNTPGGPR